MIGKTTVLAMIFLTVSMTIATNTAMVYAGVICPDDHTANGDGTCTFGYVNGVHEGVASDSGTGSTCTTTRTDYNANSNLFNRATTNTNYPDCSVHSYKFDISTIPNSATITDVSFKTTIGAPSTGDNCNIKAIQFDPITASPSDLWDDILNGTAYLTSDNICNGAGTKTRDLGTSADSDLQDALTQDWFAIGMATDDVPNRTSADIWVQSSSPQLQVTYIPPNLFEEIENLTQENQQLQNQIASVNATVQDNTSQIDYIYTEWTKIKNAIVDWLTDRP
ncbi:hypothetical protein [Nitrosopumilus piranensis]|uniref:Uncharacterized protein n=1 Tax=Nitrosopumilus piranensis TaxID=1582439 RepID=A0A0C5C9B9_9ARCH|nr:hypothetical protein [Nitrosopumilus piranensis]AJM91807.1 exported protein of unknown function [Nitrosopumilus piranensis]